MHARVLVKPKAGILDPQGQAVERALPALGFTGVRNVHVGRMIELEMEDPARLPELCERLLTNPLIEDYEIVDRDGLSPTAAPRPGTAAAPRPGTAAPPLPRTAAPPRPGTAAPPPGSAAPPGSASA